MSKLITLLLVLLCFDVSAQLTTDTLNKFNENGKKQGYWLVYLTDRLIPTTDTSQTFFYAFNYYDNDVLVGYFNIGNPARKRASKIDYGELKPRKGKVLLLSGHITFYDKDSVSLDETYLNGVPILRRGFFYNKKTKACKYKQTLNYKYTYKNEKGSFYYEYFNYVDSINHNNNVACIEKVWYRKKRKSWNLHYITSTPEFNSGKERYEIDLLDKNGKGNLYRTIRKHLQPRINFAYEQTHVVGQWLKGAGANVMIIVPQARVGISWNYSFLTGYSPKNYGFNTERSIFFYEKGFALHYFFIYKKGVKSSISLDFLGDDYFQLHLKNANGDVTSITNKYWIVKPGLRTSISVLKNIDLYAQVYYRWVYYPYRNSQYQQFGSNNDFCGVGFCVGFSIK